MPDILITPSQKSPIGITIQRQDSNSVGVIQNSTTTLEPSVKQSTVIVKEEQDNINIIVGNQDGTPVIPVTLLSELDDVEILNPVNGEVLKYDSSDFKWKNRVDSTGSGVGSEPERGPEFTYDSSGNIVLVTYDSGNTKVLSYDLVGNVSSIIYQKGSITETSIFEYDLEGNLLRVNFTST